MPVLCEGTRLNWYVRHQWQADVYVHVVCGSCRSLRTSDHFRIVHYQCAFSNESCLSLPAHLHQATLVYTLYQNNIHSSVNTRIGYQVCPFCFSRSSRSFGQVHTGSSCFPRFHLIDYWLATVGLFDLYSHPAKPVCVKQIVAFRSLIHRPSVVVERPYGDTYAHFITSTLMMYRLAPKSGLMNMLRRLLPTHS